jgi:hypothetical protein
MATRLLLLSVLGVIHAAGCASQPAVSDAPPLPQKRITDFGTIETAETVVVLVQSDQPLTYTVSRQEDLPGVSFRFPDTRLDGLDAAYFPPANPVIRSIRSTQAADRGETRVSLELAQDVPYEMIPNPDGLKIVFRKPRVEAAAGKMPALPSGETAKIETTPTMSTVTPATLLREVRTETRADGVVIRVIADGSIQTANVFTLENPARIVFDLMGLRSAFPGEQRIPVRSEWVNQVRHHGYPDKVRLVLDTDLHYLKSYALEPAVDGLQITVAGPKP